MWGGVKLEEDGVLIYIYKISTFDKHYENIKNTTVKWSFVVAQVCHDRQTSPPQVDETTNDLYAQLDWNVIPHFL